MRYRAVWDESDDEDASFGRVSYPGVAFRRKHGAAETSISNRDWSAVKAGFREEFYDNSSTDDYNEGRAGLQQSLLSEVVVKRHSNDLWSDIDGSDPGSEHYEDDDFEESEKCYDDDFEGSEEYNDDDFEESDSQQRDEIEEQESCVKKCDEDRKDDGMSLKDLTRLLLQKKGVISNGKKLVKNPGAKGWEGFMKKWPQRAKYIENLAKPKRVPRRKKEKGRVLTEKEMEEFVHRMRMLEKERWAKIIAMGHAEEETFLKEIQSVRGQNGHNCDWAGKAKDPEDRKIPFHERVQQRWRDKLQREARWADWYRKRAWENFRTQTPELYRSMLRAKREDEEDAMYHVRFWNFDIDSRLSKELKTMFKGFQSAEPLDLSHKKRRGYVHERKYAFYIFPLNHCGCVYYTNRVDAENAASYMNGRTVFGKYEMPESRGGLKCRVGKVKDLFISRVLEGDVINQCLLDGYVYDSI